MAADDDTRDLELEDEVRQELLGLLKRVRQNKNPEAAKHLLELFIRDARFGGPSHPLLAQFAAECLERVMRGDPIENILGKRKPGRRKQTDSYHGWKKQKQVVQAFICARCKGFTIGKAVNHAAETCDVHKKTAKRHLTDYHERLGRFSPQLKFFDPDYSPDCFKPKSG